MSLQEFATVIAVIALIAFSGAKEIVPRKTELPSDEKPGEKKVTYYHGNRPLGAFLLMVATVAAFILAVKVGWITIPGITR